jgi:hypothetical protein
LIVGKRDSDASSSLKLVATSVPGFTIKATQILRDAVSITSIGNLDLASVMRE